MSDIRCFEAVNLQEVGTHLRFDSKYADGLADIFANETAKKFANSRIDLVSGSDGVFANKSAVPH